MKELPVKTEAHVKLDLQIKDIALCLCSGLPPQLIVSKHYYSNNGSIEAWIISSSSVLPTRFQKSLKLDDYEQT